MTTERDWGWHNALTFEELEAVLKPLGLKTCVLIPWRNKLLAFDGPTKRLLEWNSETKTVLPRETG